MRRLFLAFALLCALAVAYLVSLVPGALQGYIVAALLVLVPLGYAVLRVIGRHYDYQEMRVAMQRAEPPARHADTRKPWRGEVQIIEAADGRRGRSVLN